MLEWSMVMDARHTLHQWSSNKQSIIRCQSPVEIQ